MGGGISFDLEADEGLAKLMAQMELSHPWQMGGALVSAGVLARGAVMVRERAMRWAMGALCVWVAGHGAVHSLRYFLTGRYLAGRLELRELVHAAQLQAGIEAALVLFLVTACLATVVLLAKDARIVGRGMSRLAVLACFAVAAVVPIDIPRFVAIDGLGAAERLARVISETETRPLTASTAGGRVRDVFAVLHADASLTLVDRDRSWHVPPGHPLPLPGERLSLIVDDRVRVGDLRALVRRVPDDSALSLGRIVRASQTRRGKGFGPVALLGVQWAPFISDRTSLLMWPEARPQALMSLPAEARVTELVEGQPLHVPRDDVVRPVLQAATEVQGVPTAAWCLLRWPFLGCPPGL